MDSPVIRGRFEYVEVAEEECGGAALNYKLAPGMIVTGIGRCCRNCRLIVCGFGGCNELMFAPAELIPLDDDARALLAEVA